MFTSTYRTLYIKRCTKLPAGGGRKFRTSHRALNVGLCGFSYTLQPYGSPARRHPYCPLPTRKPVPPSPHKLSNKSQIARVFLVDLSGWVDGHQNRRTKGRIGSGGALYPYKLQARFKLIDRFFFVKAIFLIDGFSGFRYKYLHDLHVSHR